MGTRSVHQAVRTTRTATETIDTQHTSDASTSTYRSFTNPPQESTIHIETRRVPSDAKITDVHWDVNFRDFFTQNTEASTHRRKIYFVEPHSFLLTTRQRQSPCLAPLHLSIPSLTF